MKKLLSLIIVGLFLLGAANPLYAVVVRPTGEPSLPLTPAGSSLPVVQSKDQASLDALLTSFIPRIISFFIGFIAVVAIFIVIWGGYQFLTAGGDTGKAEKAIQTIMWSTTGLTIALLAFIIVQIIVNIRLVAS